MTIAVTTPSLRTDATSMTTRSLQSRIHAFFELSTPHQFSRIALTILFGLLVVLLLPILSYPLGPDNGLFYVSGQKIVTQGAVPYRDIVDVKPPLIYYTNAIAITAFGDSPLSIRLLDLLLQLLTCFLLFKLMRRASGSDRSGAIATVLYALLYIGLNYANTSQVESYLGLFALPSLYLFLFRRSPSSFMLIGFLCGILVFYKFTFGILLAGFLLSDIVLYHYPLRERLRNFGLMIAGFGAVLGLFLLYLFTLDAAHGFGNMQEFLSGYTGIQWESKTTLIRETLRQLPINLADKYSLVMLLGTIAGIGLAFTGVQGEKNTPSTKNTALSYTEGHTGTALLRVCSILFILLLGTIALEAKWIHYHISRLFPFGVILGAYGLSQMFRFIAANRRGRFGLFLLPIGAVLFIAFSPLTRYVSHLRPAIAMVRNGPEAFDAFYAHNRESDGWTLQELQEIGELIRGKQQAGDKVFVSSLVGSMLYLQCGYVPDLPIYHSGFLIAPFAPEEWRDTVRSFLLNEHPRFVVIQQSDRMPGITNVMTTSAELIRERMPSVQEMLATEYEVIHQTTAFVVYEK